MDSYISKNLFIEKKERNSSFAMSSPHHHKSYELYYLVNISGSAYINIGNKKTCLKEGCIVIIDSGISHQTDFSQSTYHKRFLLEINPNFLKRELGQVIGIPINLFFQQYTGVYFLDRHIRTSIEDVLNAIYSESIFKEKYYEDIALLRILEIILLLDRNCEQLYSENTLSANQIKTIRPVVQYIVDNLEVNLSLELLSYRFYLDKSYLSRAFKQYTGHTVHDFINVKRIERAQRILLRQPASSISSIAHQLGFNNTAYFSKVFKKHTDTTPTKFRKANT